MAYYNPYGQPTYPYTAAPYPAQTQTTTTVPQPQLVWVNGTDEAGSYDDYAYYMDYEDNPEKLAHNRQMSYYDRTRVPYHDPTYTDGMIMHKRNPNTGRYMSHSDETDHSRTRTMQHLERMLDQAATDEERKTIISCMNKL